MICDDCKKCWYFGAIDSANKEGDKCCHYCYYNGTRRGELVDGRCRRFVEAPNKRLDMMYRCFNGGRCDAERSK